MFCLNCDFYDLRIFRIHSKLSESGFTGLKDLQDSDYYFVFGKDYLVFVGFFYYIVLLSFSRKKRK